LAELGKNNLLADGWNNDVIWGVEVSEHKSMYVKFHDDSYKQAFSLENPDLFITAAPPFLSRQGRSGIFVQMYLTLKQ